MTAGKDIRIRDISGTSVQDLYNLIAKNITRDIATPMRRSILAQVRKLAEPALQELNRQLSTKIVELRERVQSLEEGQLAFKGMAGR